VGDDPDPAARIQRLRARLGLSQEQLARQLGVSFATVNRWESGRTHMSARASRALAEFEARAAAGDSPPTAGLPVAQSSFIGRAAELTELSQIIATSRLVSLVGPGGAGKTRLAIDAIRRGSQAAEVAFVPLEPVRQPASLVPAVASCLRVRDQPGLSLQECLAAALTAAPRLLLLDGAEHLRDAVAELAASCSPPPAGCGSWSPAGSCSACPARCAGPSRRWSARPPRRARPTSRQATRYGCSSPGRTSGCRGSPAPMSHRTPSPNCAGASMACRWPSS